MLKVADHESEVCIVSHQSQKLSREMDKGTTYKERSLQSL